MTGRRDSAFGVSIVVPPKAWKSFQSADEFQSVHWVDAKSLISYYYYPLAMSGPVSYDRPAEDQCLVRVNGRRVLVETDDRMGKRGLPANFEMSSAKHKGFGMAIFGPDRRTVCALGARTMWSALFGDNSLRTLTILGISEDATSFFYEDAFGIVTRAKVGNKLPDGDSTVRAISPQSVTIRTVEPDGTGGWKEVDRVMSSVQAWTVLDISPDKSSFHYKDAFGNRMTAESATSCPMGPAYAPLPERQLPCACSSRMEPEVGGKSIAS